MSLTIRPRYIPTTRRALARFPRQATPGTTPARVFRAFPWLADRLEAGRLTDADYADFDRAQDDFGAAAGGHTAGRGDAYRAGQQRHPLARAHGVATLFDLITPPGGGLRPWHVILDSLGGNGTLARVIRDIRGELSPRVVTADLSRDQVASALEQGLPALRQPAQKTHFAEGSLDGVLFAYGTHHVPEGDRQALLAEAYRVLRPGARVVLQDFEEGSPTARWYSDGLHRYTMTGHDCAHFTRTGLLDLLNGAGFAGAEIRDVDDSFHIVGDSPASALHGALKHLVGMFGMVKIPAETVDDPRRLFDLLRPYFPAGPTARPLADGRFLAVLPRTAIVAVGTKPGPPV